MSRAQAEVDPRRLQGVPRVRKVRKAHDLLDAEDAIFLASTYRLIPDAWQDDVVRSWMGRRRDGKWVHKRCGLCVPRQNGKNASLEVRELYGLIYLHEAILHTAHQVKTSRKAFARLKEFFGEEVDDPNAKFPELNALVADVRSTNGQEGIFLKDLWRVDGHLVRSIGRPAGDDVEYVARGGFIEFATRTKKGARGTTYDLLVVDECQHLTDEQLAAIRPTISSGALGNSQVIYLGTAPDPEEVKKEEGVGAAWTRIRAQAGKSKDLCWIEFGAPDGPMPDPDDMVLLYAVNPSLGVRHGNGSYGLDLEVIFGEDGNGGEKADMSAADYARERLGWWGNPDAKSSRGVIDMTQWRELKVAGDQLPARGLVVVDVSPDLEWTTVALITDGPDGRPLALVDRHAGTSWPPARVKQLVDDLDDVLEVAITPSAHIFSAALTKLGIPEHKKADDGKRGVRHRKLTAGEVGAGCTAFQQMVKDGEVAHVGQATLDIAVRQGTPRFVGSDVQLWDRRDRKTDISPLVAVSVGVHRWALAVAKAPTTPVRPRRRSLGQQPSRATAQASASASTRAPLPSGGRRGRDGSGFDPRSSGF